MNDQAAALDTLMERMVAEYVARNQAAGVLKAMLDETGVGFWPVIDHVTIRTFDLGGDKLSAALRDSMPTGPNPALGLRAVRFGLSEPALLKGQLRALLADETAYEIVTFDKVEEAPRAFLPQLLYKPANPYPNTTVSYAVQRDVRCMVVEIGGGYQEQHLHVANGVRGVMNQLRYCGVLPGEVKRRPGQVLMHDLKVLRPRMGGLCVPHQHLVPGQQLPAGTALADIVSPYTFETLETMQAPFDDNIVVLCRNYATRIHPGDYGFMIGNGATSVPYTD